MNHKIESLKNEFAMQVMEWKRKSKEAFGRANPHLVKAYVSKIKQERKASLS